MFSLLPKLPGLPGPDDIRGVVRRVDTARHNGIPDGCILELDLQHAPPETAGFDPMALLAGHARPLTLREMVAAYAAIADGGRYREPVLVTQVEDADGHVLERIAPPPPEEALDPAVAYTLLDTLRGQGRVHELDELGNVGHGNSVVREMRCDDLGRQRQQQQRAVFARPARPL